MLKALSDRDSDYTIINSGMNTHAVQYQGKLIATISPVERVNSSLQLTDQQKGYYEFMIHAYDGPAHGKTFFAVNVYEVAEQVEILVNLNASDDLDADTVITWQNKEDTSHAITVLGMDRDSRYVFWMNNNSPSALCGTNEVDFTEVFKPIYPEVDKDYHDPLVEKYDDSPLGSIVDLE